MRPLNPLFLLASFFAISPGLRGDPVLNQSATAKDEIVSVNAYVANGYVRTKQADGQYATETYAFGEGGRISGRARDLSIDNLSFNKIAHIIAVPLADHQYMPAKVGNDTDLLIMVYWGTTAAWAQGTDNNATQNWGASQKGLNLASKERAFRAGTRAEPSLPPSLKAFYQSEAESAMIMMDQYNRSREKMAEETARLIGYADELHSTDDLKQFAGLGPYRNDLMTEIEDDRYFVILVACDFQMAWKEKKLKPLWSTRYNLRVRGNEFDQALPDMTRFASRYFGQSTKGLIRNRIPVGRVEIGEAKVIDTHR